MGASGVSLITSECSVCTKLSNTLFLLTSSFFMSQRFYPVSARNWFTLDSVQLRSNDVTATFVGSRSINAPAEYSYHCQSVSSSQDDALLVLNSANQSTSGWRLDFVDFQVHLQCCNVLSIRDTFMEIHYYK